MSKPEWGTKRICVQCGERFYDLNKDPIKCPNCGVTMSVEEFLEKQATQAGRSKRGIKGKYHEDLDMITAEDTAFEETAGDDELELIEDASDLGDDNHDMAEVMDNVEKGEE